MKIFVKATNWVGDAVLVTPTLAGLRILFPQSHITVMARPSVADVYEANTEIDRVWTAEETRSIGWFRTIARRIRDEKFDIGLALPNSIGAALLMAMGRIKRRVGYSRDGRRLLLTDPVKATPEILNVHEVEYYLNLLRVFGNIDSIPRKLVVPVAPEADRLIRRVLDAHDLPDAAEAERPLVGMCPGAAFGTAKRWLPDRFAAVADEISERYGARVLIVGSKGERSVGEEIARMAKSEVEVLSGEFPLRGLIALMDHLRLFITNDSGAMHVAAARNVPIVAIFGPTNWTTTAPYHPDAIIVRRETPCAPCMLRECPREHECMKNVSIDDVLGAVDRQMRADRYKVSI